ncbi:hypothetical protein EYF80_032846 [Liparis tanakae]|uniref:Uncharacterized protein n=1 Tax=Liparis tanakae TaxID=230148 RepID=A0A4Z2GTI1_9TELE|nr:hypothetical protein EYF80_032846 [Liparis tanakae]
MTSPHWLKLILPSPVLSNSKNASLNSAGHTDTGRLWGQMVNLKDAASSVSALEPVLDLQEPKPFLTSWAAKHFESLHQLLVRLLAEGIKL